MSDDDIPRLDPDPLAPFPDPALSRHPDGLIAWGGDLNPTRVLNAYQAGIFPWYNTGSPVLWWSPDPRAVFDLQAIRLPTRLLRQLRSSPWIIRIDSDFEGVISACQAPRRQEPNTWITPQVKDSFMALHRQGHAHSVEVWEDGTLIGGVYGMAVGRIFSAESKFHRKPNASKVALAYLLKLTQRWGFNWVDCQIPNPHLSRLGATSIPRQSFLEDLKKALKHDRGCNLWPTQTEPFAPIHWSNNR